MKNASQLFVGLLSAIGSAMLVFAAATLALLEGGGGPPVPVFPSPTPIVISTSNLALNQSITPPSTSTFTPTSAPTEVNPCPHPKDWIKYTIQSGDTIDSLVEQTQVSKEDFLKGNCFRSASIPLEPGWTVYIPAPAASTPTEMPTETQTPEPPLPTVPVCGPPAGWIFYTVKQGDNLYRISLAFGITQDQLMTANCLTTTRINVGQRLYVPNRPTITPAVTLTPTPTNTPLPPIWTNTPTNTPTVTSTLPGKLDQSINFAPLPDKVLSDPPFAVSAVASSGLPVSFSASGNCTVSGSTVTLSGVGSCDITASQPGNGMFNPAPPITQSFQITQASQTINFPALSDKTITDPPFAVSATASSGLPVSFTASGSCTIAGDTVTLTNAGSCAITAAQDGNSNYLPAIPVTRTFQVNKAGQTITLSTLSDKTISDPPFTVSVTADSGLPVSLSASGVCTIAGNTVTLTGVAGTCTISASQDGNSNYLPANAARSFQVN
jgi:LysM repeat protein